MTAKVTRRFLCCTAAAAAFTFRFRVNVQAQGESGTPYDLIITNGRVVDPKSKLDAIRNVGIKDGKLVAMSERELSGTSSIEAGVSRSKRRANGRPGAMLGK